ILEALLTHILECKIEPPRGILLDPRRDADTAWVGQTFETSRDIHPIAKDVTVLHDDVTLMNAYSEFDAVVWCAGSLFGHAALPFGRATQCINDAGELN